MKREATVTPHNTICAFHKRSEAIFASVHCLPRDTFSCLLPKVLKTSLAGCATAVATALKAHELVQEFLRSVVLHPT